MIKMDFKQAVAFMKEQTHIYAERVREGVVVEVKFSRRMKNLWGTCDPVRKIITYNLKWVDVNQNNEEALKALVIHECCHLRFLYHNRDFEGLCQSFGLKTKRTRKNVENIIAVEQKCVGICPGCGKECKRHNLPKYKTSCCCCDSVYNDKYQLHYKRVD